MLDMIDRPRLVHRIMAILRDGTLPSSTTWKPMACSCLNTDQYVGSGGFGYTRELPARVPTVPVRTGQMWGFGESQETVGVSPEMFEEFIFPYQLPLLERFGLNCYGCCEPLDARWHVVKQVPDLRRVSVSPWADLEKMAEKLEDRYVYSRKPHPAAWLRRTLDEEVVRADLRATLRPPAAASWKSS